jgi:type IV fimbrial biogenesis protein FimT
MNTCCKVVRGFTLIELMVTVALIAILSMVAAPSFVTFQRNSELTSFTNSMIGAVNAARGEAMKRGRYAMLTPTDNADWKTGWKAFVSFNATTRAYDSTQDSIVFTREAAPSYLTITANGSANDSPPYIMFDASGYTKKKDGSPGNLTFKVYRNDVDTSQVNAETRLVIISVTGRVRVCKPTSATDSTCNTSSTL